MLILKLYVSFTDVPDPFDRKNVRIAQSTLANSGDGVFALKDFPPGRCICLYSGNIDNKIFNNY